MNAVLHHIRQLAALEDSRGLGDQELLRRFVERRDQAAFAALVDRHGPLMLSACRGVLRSEQEAEDVLQAAFLVFVRQAHAIRRSEAVGSWLYGVVYRLARKARVRAARQRAQESRAAWTACRTGPDTVTVEEARLILEEELHRLPDKYRAPILLCCLEGKSRDEAAQELGWAEGAVKIRLERGRALLRSRLAHRGLTFSAALSAALLANGARAALPARLTVRVVEEGMKFALGRCAETLPIAAATLANDLLRTMAATRMKTVAFALLLTAVIGVGAGGWICAALGWGVATPTPGSSAGMLAQPPADDPPANSPLEKRDLTGPGTEPPPGPVPRTPKQTEGPTVVGLFRPDRARPDAFVLRESERDTAYGLAPELSVILDGKIGSLADLRSSCRVRATLSPDQKQVVRIVAEGPVVACRLVSTDTDRCTLTVWWPDDTPRRRTLAVAPEAVIDREDKPALLSELRESTEVWLTLSMDRATVLRIALSAR